MNKIDLPYIWDLVMGYIHACFQVKVSKNFREADAEREIAREKLMDALDKLVRNQKEDMDTGK